MGNKTEIAWTDSTWNPTTGCTKVSQGCKNCYAERIFARPYPGRKFTDVRTHSDRLEQPLHWKKPRRIFVNSMSDLFHEAVPDEFIDQVFAVMEYSPRHTYQILTKRPIRMVAYFKNRERREVSTGLLVPSCITTEMYLDHALPLVWPLPNVHLGVSVENQEAADERIPLLLQTPAAVRFLSIEPLLEPVNFMRVLLEENLSRPRPQSWAPEDFAPGAKIDWVIVGGESGPHARSMDLAWVRSLRDQCKAAGIPLFVKQLSQADMRAFKDFDAFPDDLKIREFPG